MCVAYMTFVVGFQGLGNVTMDCTIVACYAQAMVQFQILKYNLEHLIKPSDFEDSALNTKRFLFIDENFVVREKIKRRLIRNVLHQQKIYWYSHFIFYNSVNFFGNCAFNVAASIVIRSFHYTIQRPCQHVRQCSYLL